MVSECDEIYKIDCPNELPTGKTLDADVNYFHYEYLVPRGNRTLSQMTVRDDESAHSR